jgi:hypothetical protein
MKLIEKIITGKWTIHESEQYVIERVKRGLTHDAKEAYCVDMQNVHEWEIAQKKFGESKEEFVCIKPPFPIMWFEYVHFDDTSNEKIAKGFLIHDDSEEANKGKPVEGVDINSMMVSHFIEMDNTVHLMGQSTVRWNPEDYSFDRAHYESPFPEEDQRRLMGRPLRGLLYAICFFHCKNVEIIERSNHPKLVRKFENLHKTKKPSFHVIEVHLSSTRTASDSSSNGNGIPRNAVIIRGHRKRFLREGSKLFGKHTGVWFWKPQVIGVGTPLANDYRVWPPNPKHRPNCIITKGE